MSSPSRKESSDDYRPRTAASGLRPSEKSLSTLGSGIFSASAHSQGASRPKTAAKVPSASMGSLSSLGADSMRFTLPTNARPPPQETRPPTAAPSAPPAATASDHNSLVLGLQAYLTLRRGRPPPRRIIGSSRVVALDLQQDALKPAVGRRLLHMAFDTGHL